MNSVDLLNGSGNSIGPHIFPVLKCEISWFDQRIHTKKNTKVTDVPWYKKKNEIRPYFNQNDSMCQRIQHRMQLLIRIYFIWMALFCLFITVVPFHFLFVVVALFSIRWAILFFLFDTDLCTFFSFILWFNAHITFICAAANFFLLNSFLDIQKSVIFIVYSFIHFDLKIHLHWRENMLDLIRRLLKLEYSLKYYMFFFWHVYFCFNIRY